MKRKILNLMLTLFVTTVLFSCRKDKNEQIELPEDNDQATFIEGFEVSSLENAHIEKQGILELENSIRNGQYNVHSILIVRDKKLVYERYFPGNDAIFPFPTGTTIHHRDSLHDCRSVTKSIVSACIGIAIAQGKIASVNDSIFTYLPAYKKYAVGHKAAITLKHLLTMSSGLEWNEQVPYSDSTNDEFRMSTQADVIDYILRKNSVAVPGTKWNYNGGCTQLLAQILKQATGISIDDYAGTYLFHPLGIKNYNWFKRDPNTVWAPSGLRMRSIDMAKFGQLYLQKGSWQGAQLVPEIWVQQSLNWQIDKTDGEGYGYQFWCMKSTIAGSITPVAKAVGNGEQRICIVPSHNLDIIITAGYYEGGSDLADDLLKYIFLPAIK